MSLHTPKVGLASASEAWYRYYAGYSARFVEDCLDYLALPKGSVIVDPWNGSGTTTFVAARRGYSSVGLDANPALLVVAKARLLGLEVAPSVMPLIHEMVDRALTVHWEGPTQGDPLARWLTPSAVVAIRSLEQAIQHLLVESNTYRLMGDPERIEALSSLACFYYVCLFKTVREAVKRFGTTNPTWVKTPASLARRVRPQSHALHAGFKDNAERLSENLGGTAQTAMAGGDEPSLDLQIGVSECLPVEDGAAGAVLTSPPYCTRIDYVMATLPELAVLGYGDEPVRALRDAMLGTPTIISSIRPPEEWGNVTSKFLRAVKRHSSQASATYYYRCFTQYFNGLSASLVEIARVLKPGATAALVVQDSYYKDLHLDLAAMVDEMGEARGLVLKDRVDFPVRSTKAAVNPRARRYRTHFEATESVIFLRKDERLAS